MRLNNITKLLITKLQAEIEMETTPLMELSSLAEDIYAKTRVVSQNTDFNM